MSIRVPSDLYNGWFTMPVSTPHIQVDYMIMNELKVKLPQHYQLPDPAIMNKFSISPKRG